MAKVSETAGAIGYVSLDVVDDTVKSLKLDGVKASEKTIKDGSYTLQRPFVMATKEKSVNKVKKYKLCSILSIVKLDKKLLNKLV